MTIGVLGATGTVSHLVVEKLSGLGLPTRALAHHEEGAGRLRLPHVDVQTGDYRSEDDLRAFLSGLDQLLLLTAPDHDQVEVQNRIIDRAGQYGVAGIVKVSAWTAAADAPLTLSRDHHAIETHLSGAGLPFTILQPHTFMQTTALLFGQEVRQNSSMTASVGPDAGIYMVDARDVADVAVAVLAAGNHSGETLVVHGPEPLSYADCAERISAHVGRPITYHLLTHDEAMAGMQQAGIPEFIADAFVTLFRMYDSGDYEPEPNTVTETWAEHPPRSYNDFLASDPAAFD